MRHWIVPSNNNYFDLDTLIKERGIVFWQQRNKKYSVGDIIYFYYTDPEKRIAYKGIVEDLIEERSDSFDEDRYWKDEGARIRGRNASKDKFVKIRTTSECFRNSLSLKSLREHGFNGSVQGPSTIKTDELIDFIEEHMHRIGDFYPDSEGMEDVLVEGAKKNVTVNAYERNPMARSKCIEHYGCACNICGIDFGEAYGEFAKGFIHVHHIVPIHEIGEEYVVDPIKDLIPVCPNCHAMLHTRLEDGSYLSPDKLRYLIKNKKTRSHENQRFSKKVRPCDV